MAYCSECGSQYEDNDSVCLNCGQNLSKEFQAEIVDTVLVEPLHIKSENTNNSQVDSVVEPLEGFHASLEGTENGKTNKIENAEKEEIPEYYKKKLEISLEIIPEDIVEEIKDFVPAINPPLSEDTVVEIKHFQEDSHLGKGIIKPQKIELGIDGIHFKYDTPLHNFVKAEPVKEKPREYRVTSSDMDSSKMIDVNIPKEPSMEELAPHVPEVTDIPTTDFMTEVILAQEKESIPEIAAETIPMITEPETTSEPVVMESIVEPTLPEYKEISEMGVIWEANQTWLKIPIGKICRVTERSLIIAGKYNNKLFELNLASITGVVIKQSWLDKLMGIGNLVITIKDIPASTAVLSGITQPFKLKQILESLCQNKL